MKNLITRKTLYNIIIHSCILICLFWVPLFAYPQDQTSKITLNLKNVTLPELFKQIEAKSHYIFFYYEDIVDPTLKVDVTVQNKSVKDILDQALSSTTLTYTVVGRQITISEKKDNTPPLPQKSSTLLKGIVYDQNHDPLPGVNIRIKGESIGVISDIDGMYQIKSNAPDEVVIFSYIGYESLEIPAKNTKELAHVSLKEDMHSVEEVVVVGYSTRTREKLISSVSTIQTQDLVKSNVPNLENALSGRVSGVFSRQESGEPGADGANLQIRGFGNALVVVDGIPGRSYSELDPSEIESISVLKDASAAAVYGMQGANGVILVTTRRGNKNKKANLDVSTRFGIQMPHNYPEAASAATWQNLVNQYYANEKLISNPNAIISPEEMAVTPIKYDTNWYDEVIKNAPISQSNISISGGSDRVNYFVSGGYLYQDGIWATNSTSKNRINFRSNLDVDILDNLKMSVGVGAIINNINYSRTESETIAGSLKIAAPNFPIRWNEYPNYYAFGGEGTTNPMALADTDAAGYRHIRNKDFNIDFALEYKIPFIEGLSLKANIGYSVTDGWQKTWTKNIVYMGYRENSDEYYESVSGSNTNKASLLLYDGNIWSVVGQGFLNYINSFGKHNINSSLVFEINEAKNRWFQTSRNEFPSTVLDMLAGGLSGKMLDNSESLREYRSASLIGRFSYDYASRYFVDFNFRYDGAQYFARKWGFFPSVSIGWLLTNEQFMSSVKPVLNEFKVRASWGELGDLSSAKSYYDNNEMYYFQSGYKYPGSTMTFGDRTLYGLTETINANPNFTWATSSMINGGIDFKLWNGLLGGSADIFYRQRSGLPAQKANDNAGALATYYNLNEDNTRGFEISVNHSNRISDFSYYVDFNLSWSRTQYGHLEHGQYTSGYDEWKWNNEYQWSNIRWGLNQIGQYESFDEIANAPMHDNSNNNSVLLPGDLKYEDWNGDGYIDEYDKRPIGRTAYPELMYGFTLGATWKGFDFTMFWQGGGLANFQISPFDMAAFQEGKTFNNTWDYFKDSWHKADYTDPNSPWIHGHFPAIRDMFTTTINTQASTFWMWNGNYLRLKNIELGYTLPENICHKLRMKSLRVYVSAYNCLTFSAQKYFDPEQRESTYSFASYPQLMSINAGLNLKF